MNPRDWRRRVSWGIGEYSQSSIKAWDRYRASSLEEFHPIDARLFCLGIKRWESPWWEPFLHERSLDEMVDRSTRQLVWVPREFHEPARISFGLGVEDERGDPHLEKTFEFLSFRDEIELGAARGIHLPFSSDFTYLLRGPFINFAVEHLGYDRLRGVRQLALLGLFTSLREKEHFSGNPSSFDLVHSRYDHQLLVGSLAEVVLTRLGSDDKTVREGFFAGAVHDLATAGLGDTMKKLDPDGLDEEAHLSRMLSPETRKIIARQFKVDPRRITRIVQGKDDDLVSRLLHSDELDLDKIAYTSLDCFEYLRLCERNKQFPELYGQIKGIIDANPCLFDIHKDIRVEDGNIVFDDPKKAYNVLLLRALMSAKLYMSDESRAKEAGYFYHLFKPLYGKGFLTPRNLRKATDTEAAFMLLATISKLCGNKVDSRINTFGARVPYAYSLEPGSSYGTFVIDYGPGRELLRFFHPFTYGVTPYHIKKYPDEKSARYDIIPEIESIPGYILKTFKGFKTGENTLVRKNGRTVPLCQAITAEELGELRRLRDMTRGTYLFVPNKDYQNLFDDIRELHRRADLPSKNR